MFEKGLTIEYDFEFRA